MGFPKQCYMTVFAKKYTSAKIGAKPVLIDAGEARVVNWALKQVKEIESDKKKIIKKHVFVWNQDP